MKLLLNGNEALALGALNAGLKIFAGYPITPSTDIYEMLEKKGAEGECVFFNAESEISAINVVFGAYASGKRAMTCTSACGFSLMQETLSYMAADFSPGVVVNVMREGAGLGDIPRSQGDYAMMTKGGGNGDYHTIVLSCQTIKDCFEAPRKAFELTEKYRNPVIITYDSDIAHTKESIDVPDKNEVIDINLPYALTGNKTGVQKVVQNIYYHEPNYDKVLKEKYDQIEREVEDYDSLYVEDADIVVVAFGICARIAKETIEILRGENKKVGLIIPKTLYPFPKSAFKNLKAKKIVVFEMNILKQMREDVERVVKDKEIISIGNMSKIVYMKEFKDFIESHLAN